MTKLEVISNKEIKRGHYLAVNGDEVVYDGRLGDGDFETLQKATTVHLHPEDVYHLKDWLRKRRSN